MRPSAMRSGESVLAASAWAAATAAWAAAGRKKATSFAWLIWGRAGSGGGAGAGAAAVGAGAATGAGAGDSLLHDTATAPRDTRPTPNQSRLRIIYQPPSRNSMTGTVLSLPDTGWGWPPTRGATAGVRRILAGSAASARRRADGRTGSRRWNTSRSMAQDTVSPLAVPNASQVRSFQEKKLPRPAS